MTIAAAAVAPGTPAAQGQAYGTVTLATTQTHDANLLSAAASAGPRADTFLRVTPSVEGGYAWPRLKVGGWYRFDADRYRRYRVLSRLFTREEAGADVRLVVTPRLRVSGDASYVETDTPRELNLDTQLTTTRRPAARRAVASSAIFDMTARLSVTAAHTFTGDMLVGSIGNDVHIGHAGLAYRSGARDIVGLNYQLRHVRFTGRQIVNDGTVGSIDDVPATVRIADTRVFHVLRAKWTHTMASHTTIDIEGGPNVGSDAVRPELFVVLRREGPWGDVTMGYARERTTALGEIGLLDVQRVSAGATFRPTPRLSLTAIPAFVYNRRERPAEGIDQTIPVYTLDALVSLQASPRLALVGSGRFGRQNGRPSADADTIVERRLGVEVVVTLVKRSGVPRQWSEEAGSSE